MAIVLESNKTKIARRVIEVFEFFAAERRQVTVMDIVRRYNRPQSSTSELLVALKEMGLLYKNPRTRAYEPTPRLAALGFALQPDPIGNGKLFAYMDRLAETSRCAVGLFGIVGTHTQVFRWSACDGMENLGIDCGSSIWLSSSAVGWLLLSSMGLTQAGRMLWRLQAEADKEDGFDLQDLKLKVARASRLGHATGIFGLASDTNVTAILLPESAGEHRLALGVVYGANSGVDPDAVVQTLRNGIEHCASADGGTDARLVRGATGG